MPEHILVRLRHAKSDLSGDEPDIDRPLAKRGLRQAPTMGGWFAANVDRIDLTVVSLAARARSTWDIVAVELGVPPPTRIGERIYAASGQRLLGAVRGLPDELDTVVLVGHNPGLEDLVSTLTGEWAALSTSAVAVIGMPGFLVARGSPACDPAHVRKATSHGSLT